MRTGERLRKAAVTHPCAPLHTLTLQGDMNLRRLSARRTCRRGDHSAGMTRGVVSRCTTLHRKDVCDVNGDFPRFGTHVGTLTLSVDR